MPQEDKSHRRQPASRVPDAPEEETRLDARWILDKSARLLERGKLVTYVNRTSGCDDNDHRQHSETAELVRSSYESQSCGVLGGSSACCQRERSDAHSIGLLPVDPSVLCQCCDHLQGRLRDRNTT